MPTLAIKTSQVICMGNALTADNSFFISVDIIFLLKLSAALNNCGVGHVNHVPVASTVSGCGNMALPAGSLYAGPGQSPLAFAQLSK